jgi:two-component system NtrC family sensor kinase
VAACGVRAAGRPGAALQIRILRLQAEAAAAMFEQAIKEIESQIGWTTQLPWSVGTMDQRRFDALRLLRQIPAVTEIAFLDATGIERLKVSRLAMDRVATGTDYSQDPKFTEAVAHKVFYGPVYLRRGSEAYMTIALAGTRRESGVSVAEVSWLKLVWDVVSRMDVGSGQTYVIDEQGRLIAHRDRSLVLLEGAGGWRNTDFTGRRSAACVRRATDRRGLCAVEGKIRCLTRGNKTLVLLHCMRSVLA